jgi:hypothetical protein
VYFLGGAPEHPPYEEIVQEIKEYKKVEKAAEGVAVPSSEGSDTEEVASSDP